MKYKGKEVGIPTVEMFNEYINRKHMTIPAEYVYDYCSKNKWLTKKGEPMYSVEAMVNSLNSFYDKSSNQTTRKPSTGIYGIVPHIQEVLGSRCPNDEDLKWILEETSNYLYAIMTSSVKSAIRGSS